MRIGEYLDSKNLHHAYLIEGNKEEILPELLQWIESIGVSTLGNPDFVNVASDTLKIEDARNFKSVSREKSFSGGKKVLIISANSILPDAQNTLLKMMEDPETDSLLFMIVPDVGILLKTFLSRFYVIAQKNKIDTEEALKFLRAAQQTRINLLKDMLVAPEETEEVAQSSARTKALQFLDALETVMYKEFSKNIEGFVSQFEHLFNVRKYLRMPGSSAKSLMESLALTIPFIK